MSCFTQSQGDLDFTSGNLKLVSDVDQCAAITLTNRFQFFLGEWFMDTRQGIPYFQQFFVKNPDIPALSQLLNRIILQTPNMQSVNQSSIAIDPVTRHAVGTFQAQTVTGAIVEGGLGTPFIVNFNAKGAQ